MFKKIILAALIVTSAAFAQFQLHVGGRAAFNFGTAYGDTPEGFKWKWGPGFNVGAAAKMDITPLVTFVPGLEVELRTASADVPFVDKASYSLWYLDFPLLARFNITPQFFADAGLSVNFNLVAKETTEFGGLSETNDIDEIKTVDFGFVAGAGFTVIPKLDVTLRFVIGLTDMIDDMGLGSKNLRAQLGVTYWFM